jgi:methionine--tRNA ligase beta chain
MINLFKKIFNSSDSAVVVPAIKQASEEIKKPVESGFISIDDLGKIKIAMGTILTAEKVQGADKLLKFSVKFSNETRTIVSGVAKAYSPEQMIGKQVPVVLNLAPRMIRGVESNGMILYAIDETLIDGVSGHKPVMLNPEKHVPDSSLVQ